MRYAARGDPAQRRERLNAPIPAPPLQQPEGHDPRPQQPPPNQPPLPQQHHDPANPPPDVHVQQLPQDEDPQPHLDNLGRDDNLPVGGDIPLPRGEPGRQPLHQIIRESHIAFNNYVSNTLPHLAYMFAQSMQAFIRYMDSLQGNQHQEQPTPRPHPHPYAHRHRCKLGKEIFPICSMNQFIY